jgi:hypothetical protein
MTAHKVVMKATKENMIRVLADDEIDEISMNLLSKEDLIKIGRIKKFWK